MAADDTTNYTQLTAAQEKEVTRLNDSYGVARYEREGEICRVWLDDGDEYVIDADGNSEPS